MPHTPSAKKSLRQNAKRRLSNRAVKKSLKLQIKKVMETAASGTLDELKVEYNNLAMKLDKAAVKRVVHPNMAARKKSQMARLVNIKAKTPAPAPAK